MYISRRVKEQLRSYANRAIVIDAQEVFQPKNPGDGRVDAFTHLGPAPQSSSLIPLDGLQLASSYDSHEGERPHVIVEVRNASSESIEVLSRELAPTLLMKALPGGDAAGYGPSDEPSFAVITRQSFWMSDGPRWGGQGFVSGRAYSWSIGKTHALSKTFTLGPEEARWIRLTFNLLAGEYQFLCGYGGGVHEHRALASNLVAFDVDQDGRGTLVSIP